MVDRASWSKVSVVGGREGRACKDEVKTVMRPLGLSTDVEVRGAEQHFSHKDGKMSRVYSGSEQWGIQASKGVIVEHGGKCGEVVWVLRETTVIYCIMCTVRRLISPSMHSIRECGDALTVR